MTIAEAEIRIFRGIESTYGKDESKSIARLVVSHVCKITATQFIVQKNDLLDPGEENSISTILGELRTGKPLQYILGQTEFYGLCFYVTPEVLIPRPETEELVEWILEWSRDQGLEKQEARIERILDIGTGSGCIPVTLKKHLSDAKVYGMDISTGALQIATENAALHDVDVQFVNADILRPTIIDSQSLEQYSIIVSNPPYITNSERKTMHQNVLNFEPGLALFVPDEDPLVFYKAIGDFAITSLASNGRLFLEINEYLGNETVQMLQAKGFTDIQLRKDMQGKDRMISASL